MEIVSHRKHKDGDHKKLRNQPVMEIICAVPKNTNMVATENLEIDLSWKLFVSYQKIQTRGSQEPKKSSLAHSLLQAVILVQSAQVTKIWHGAKNLSERCLIHLICVLFTVNRDIP